MLWATVVLTLLAIHTASAPVIPSHEVAMPSDHPQLMNATFAGGCFWCMEPPFEKLPGVLAVTSGYAGGEEAAPTYDEVSSGTTGHVESVQVTYDANLVSYEQLLDAFWHNVDPTDNDGQFVDRGKQYRTVIFYHTPEQRIAAEKSKKALEVSGVYDKPIVTPIIPFTTFYPAEDYHQDYYKKNPIRYKYYRHGSGRDDYLQSVWAKNASNNSYVKPSDAELQKKLTPLQYDVTQHEGTEKPFENTYWDNHEAGIYVDIVSGEPLFSSLDKYDSGTGWPSFTQPLDKEHIVERKDRKLFVTRTEVRSKLGDNHLGHVFADGPAPTGMRYCMNSAALRFVPASKLEEEGYGQYASLFKS